MVIDSFQVRFACVGWIDADVGAYTEEPVCIPRVETAYVQCFHTRNAHKELDENTKNGKSDLFGKLIQGAVTVDFNGSGSPMLERKSVVGLTDEHNLHTTSASSQALAPYARHIHQ